MYEYVKPAWQGPLKLTAPTVDFSKFGAAYIADRPSITPAIPQVSRYPQQGRAGKSRTHKVVLDRIHISLISWEGFSH